MSKSKLTYDQIIELLDKKIPFRQNTIFEDSDTTTFRELFHDLLFSVLAQGEGFSGKRPYGNSSWQCNLDHALVDMGAVKGKIIRDEYGCVEDEKYNETECWAIIEQMLSACFYPVPSSTTSADAS